MKCILPNIRFLFFSFCLLLGLFSNSVPALSYEKINTGNTGKRWAFCIGIGDYQDPQILDLSAARNDAAGLAFALKKHGKFDQILVFTDDLPKNDPFFPTKKNIQFQLNRLAKVIEPDDLILFSFSGHGITAPSGVGYLLPVDARISRPGRTGLSLGTVLDFIKKTGVKKSILVLDANRKRVKKTGKSSLAGIYPDRYLREGVTALFYAARKGQYSHDHDKSINSVLAHYLIKGFEGEADSFYGGNSDNMVTLLELAGYVREGITKWASKESKNQRPYIKILDTSEANMVLASTFMTAAAVREEKVKEKPDTIRSRTVQARERESLAEKKESTVGATVGAPAPKIEDLVRKDDIESKPQVAMKPRPSKAESPKEEKQQKRPQEIEVGAPAPEIDQLVKEEKAKDSADEVKKAEKETPKEIEVAKALPTPAEEAMETKEAPLKVETAIAPEKTIIEKKEALDEKQEEPKGYETADQVIVASLPPVQKQTPLLLRKIGRDISTEDLRAMLHKNNFYATCWNYNGDFCNPDGNFETQFVDNNNGTITDKATGLMWQKGGSPGNLTWVEAKAYTRQMNDQAFAGHNDWRVPSIEELASLMETAWKNADLFIDPLFDRQQRYCWSQDTMGISRAWKANFHMGFFLDFPMISQNSVRLVRSIP